MFIDLRVYILIKSWSVEHFIKRVFDLFSTKYGN